MPGRKHLFPGVLVTLRLFVTVGSHKMAFMLPRIGELVFSCFSITFLVLGCHFMSAGRLNIIVPNIKQLRLTKKPPMTQKQLAIQLELLDWFLSLQCSLSERKIMSVERFY
jgi:hypothetical protein